MKVLIIEDSVDIIDAVNLTLELRWADAKVISTTTGEKGIELARNEQPDIIILDLGLPDIDGYQVLREIRSFSDVPIVILTVAGDEIDRIKGLEMGADDFIVKPFSPGEFLARLRAILRRKGEPEEKEFTAGKPFIRGRLRIDFISREVSVGDKPLQLGPTEYKLLYELVANQGKLVLKKHLSKIVTGTEEPEKVQYTDIYISKLKEKLEAELGHIIIVQDEEGSGYKFISS